MGSVQWMQNKRSLVPSEVKFYCSFYRLDQRFILFVPAASAYKIHTTNGNVTLVWLEFDSTAR